MRATFRGRTLASAPVQETVTIEGNVYFPPHAIAREFLKESDTPYVCPWKGRSQYFHAVVDDETFHDVAWSYPKPLASAVDTVGRDFAHFVAFSPGVAVTEA
ncbi:DUF427 domain-containing protein [Streptomyces nigra]|uniref:DUF427 domain-containing protein n=1 Tax=Streptomyces nigra TaxID=1827580 RepID=UPI0036BE5EE6